MTIFLENINEASDLRLHQHITEGDLVACITAFRNPKEIVKNVPELYEQFPDWEKLLANDATLSQKDKRRKTELLNRVLNANRQRNKELEMQIRRLHWGFNKIEGHWVEKNGGDVIEETFLIYAPASQEDILTTFLISATDAYNQDCSLLVIDGEAYRVDKKGRDKKPKGKFILRPTELGRAYSKIKDKPFRFGAVLESCEIKDYCSNHLDFFAYRTDLRDLNELRENYCQESIGKGNLIGADW